MKRFSLIQKRGLFFKIGLMVLALLIIGIGTITVVSIREQTKTIKAELIEKNKSISTHLASSAKNAFWSLNWLFVENQMHEVTSSEDVIFLAIIKPNGETYMSSGDKESVKNIEASELKSQERQIVKDLTYSKSGETTKLIITPIKIGNEQWSLIMIISLKQVENAQQAILKTNIGYGSVIFFLGMLFAFFFSRGMYRRISKLMGGIEEIAKGNLDYKIGKMGLDEIGNLANSFNKMTEDLKKTTTSRDLLAKEMAERKRVEEVLQESEEKYRTILENIEDAYYEVDIAGNFTFFNDSLCKILGYPKDELMGMNNRQYTDKENLKKLYQTFNKVYNTGKPDKGFDYKFIRKDGNKGHANASISLMKDAEDKPIGFRGIIRNVTERKQAEEEKKKLQAQLQQAQKMEAIGTLAGGIAHDFNNILSLIIGYTELALDDVPEGTPVRDNINEAYKAGKRARDLVKQILTFSRQREEERKPVQIHLIVKEALKMLRSTLPTTIEIRQNIASTATVLADPTQIHQVIMNLCTNAYYAMQEKGGLLEVSLADVKLDSDFTARHPDIYPGPYLKLTVSDTGHGIEKKDINRIFEPYYTTREKSGGTGMGLSVVHGIIKSHGGAISVYSEPGKGSAFHVFFPRIESPDPVAETEVVDPLPLGNERILFVDDELAIIDIEKRMLEHLGYKVEGRTSSIEALEAFRAQPDKFDLVITDMTMPNMTGDELARELMRIRPDLPIILCTGFSELIDEQKAKAMGIRAFVMKPVVMAEMAKAVRKALDK